MDLATAGIDRLTFGEIARRWALEDAGAPSGLDEDATLNLLNRAYLLGEFDEFEIVLE